MPVKKKAAKNAVVTNPGAPKSRPLVGAAARSFLASQSGGKVVSKKDDNEKDENKDVDEHPLAANHYIVVKYRDDSPRLAKILGKGGKDKKTWQYYVHYFDFNRRMDEWIKIDRILVYPSEANALGKQRADAEMAIHKKKHATQQKEGGTIGSTSPAPRPISGAAAANKQKKLQQQQAAAAAAVAVAEEGGESEGEDDSSVKRRGRLGKRKLGEETGDTDMDVEGGEEGTGGKENFHTNKAGAEGGGNRLVSSGKGSPPLSGMGEKKDSSQELLESLSLQDLNKSMRENRHSMLSLLGKPLDSMEDDEDEVDDDDGDDMGGSRGITNIEELEHDEHEGLDEDLLKEHEELTKIKNFTTVQLGRHIMECWYFSPFPKEYWEEAPVECIYFCEFTMRFFSTKEELVRYQNRPTLPRAPPGLEIYRDSEVSMFEVDGAVEKIYCQNLSYLAKLFLDHKTLFEDVDVFLFYVLCTHDKRGFHPVGYFSKNKYSDAGYNLACILTFPSSQRKGYGKFLIQFSYELSKKENKVGSPEKPLSDLGFLSYSSYWGWVLLSLLKATQSTGETTLSIMDISCRTSIVSHDVLQTLELLGLLVTLDNGTSVLDCTEERLDALLLKYPTPSLLCDPDKLHWAPLYVTDPNKDKWSIAGKGVY